MRGLRWRDDRDAASIQPLSARTWLLSGIPRAGTSLCCRLADRLPNTVALSEPMDAAAFADTEDANVARERIDGFVAATRRRALAEGIAPTVHVQGRLDDDMVSAGPDAAALRRRRTERGDIRIDKPLTPDFTLLVKHNALFAALLPQLANGQTADGYACLALVRNPVAALASWRTVDLPVQRGRVPAGERFAPRLRAALAQEADVLGRQVAILNWFFEQYHRHLPPQRILRYEDVVATGGGALYAALDAPQAGGETLANKNASAQYGAGGELLARLLSAGGAWRRFYARPECERAAQAIDTSGAASAASR